MNRASLLSLGAVATLTSALVVGFVPSLGAAPEPTDPRPLRILLTNDDGWRGQGGADTPLIVKLRDALTAAGNDVTVVVPATDQSGKGTSITQTPLALSQVQAGVWTVSGTPRDSVNLGLDVVMAADPPDLVVSGMNPGGNYTVVTNSSGTMGAATRAAERGIPAMAISIDSLKPAESSEFGDEAAAYSVDLVAAVAGHRRDLRGGVVLNVNYPARPVRGTKLTTVDPKPYITLTYAPVQSSPGTYALALTPTSGSPTPGSDWDALADGFVSITPITADPTADPRDLRYLARVPVG